MFCFAPVVLIGYLLTVNTAWHQTTNVDAPMIEVQTCERQVGLNMKLAPSTGLYGTGLQYGFHWDLTDHLGVTLLPKVGISHATKDYKELPLGTQFEVGAQILFGYDRLRIGVEYWHLSNAGLKSPNTGLDMIAVQTGWAF